VRTPAQKVLDELDILCAETSENLYVAHGPHARSNLIAATCEAGVELADMTMFDDVTFREENRMAIVVNKWAHSEFRCSKRGESSIFGIKFEYYFPDTLDNSPNFGRTL
jgi:ribulose 1,5-bisphosphate synthetase/thiazole synthase